MQLTAVGGHSGHSEWETEAWRGDGIGFFGTWWVGPEGVPTALMCCPRPQNAS